MRKIFLTALFLIVFIFIPFPTYAKDYSIESVNFEVNINKDGSANIIETRKYNFSPLYFIVNSVIGISVSKPRYLKASTDSSE